jgi:hypothetical protein
MKNKFKDESEIIAVIDKYHDQIKEDLIEMQNFNTLADALRMTCEAHRINKIRDEIETIHRQIEWRMGRLDTLKEVLSEMRTMELPFNNETSISKSNGVDEKNIHSE